MEARDLDTTVWRHKLENALRLRLEAGKLEYQKATAHYQRLLQANEDGLKTNSDDHISVAREDASVTLNHYVHTMRIFTDLTVYYKVTEETYSAAFGEDNTFPCRTSVSIVDDDQSVRDATRALLRSAGYWVETFESAQLFLRSGAVRHSACVVVDLRMPEIDGLELQRRLNAAKSTVPMVFISAHEDSQDQREAMEAGAVDFFHKPFEGAAFLVAIETALQRTAQEALTFPTA